MPTPLRRHWLQFGLGTSLIFIAVLAMALSELPWTVTTEEWVTKSPDQPAPLSAKALRGEEYLIDKTYFNPPRYATLAFAAFVVWKVAVIVSKRPTESASTD